MASTCVAAHLIVGVRAPSDRVPFGLSRHEFSPSRNRRLSSSDPALASSGVPSGRRHAAMPWLLFRQRDGNQRCRWQLSFGPLFTRPADQPRHATEHIRNPVDPGSPPKLSMKLNALSIETLSLCTLPVCGQGDAVGKARGRDRRKKPLVADRPGDPEPETSQLPSWRTIREFRMVGACRRANVGTTRSVEDGIPTRERGNENNRVVDCRNDPPARRNRSRRGASGTASPRGERIIPSVSCLFREKCS
jgi:hypothetical protein